MDVEANSGAGDIGTFAPVAADPTPSEALASIATRVVLAYLVVGAAWILVTDLVIAAWGEAVSAVAVVKGLFFVAGTGAVLWVVLRRLTSRFDRMVVRTVTAQRDFYGSVLATSTDIVAIVAADGRFVYVNDAVTHTLGWLPSELVGRRARELLHPADRTAAVGYRAGVARAGDPDRTERTFLVRHQDGSFRTMAVRGGSIPLAQGVGVVLNVRDVTERARSERQLRAALAEDVTGLPNLRMFIAEMELVDQLEPSGLVAMVALVDVERFGDVNQLHGRSAGDVLLRELAQRLTSVIPEAVGVWRHGADEFVLVVLDDACDGMSPTSLADRIQAVADAPVTVDERCTEVSVDLSVGVAHVDLSAHSGPEPLGTLLLRSAEGALLAAKQHPDRTAVREEARGRSGERARLLAELHEALDRDQLTVHYQPKVRLSDMGVAGVEALVRWQHPDRGLLGPAHFLDAVADANLSAGVLRVVLHDALHRTASWSSAEGCDPDFMVCVNVSADDLRRKRFGEDVFAALEHTGVAAERLCLELTEQTMLADLEAVRDVVDELRRAGIQVAIDDFGTGYSTLEHIRFFEVDELKIDKGFVQRLGSSPADEAIVDSVLAIGDRLGVRVVAEGIEHVAALEHLRDRCALGQGYLFSRPVPGDEIDPCRTYDPTG